MRNTQEKPWYEQNEFWETFEPYLFDQSRVDSAKEEVEQITALIDIQAGSVICDLSCGVGRHSLELTRRGYTVVGVDRTKRYLQQAQAKAKAENLKVEFVQDDIRSFCRHEAFDVVTSLFTSFGYFEDAEDDKQVVKNMYDSLKPGGKLLIDVMGKEVMAKIFCEHHWQQVDDYIVLHEVKVCKNWSWIESRWIMIKDDHRKEVMISHRVYSAVELKNLLETCGFGSVSVYGDLAGADYDHNAKRLIVVAQK